jgi:hypothetical protein
MPDFFDEPMHSPSPTHALPLVRQAARRRRTRSNIIAGITAVVVVAGAGIAVGAVQQHGSPKGGSVQIINSPTPSRTAATPRVTPTATPKAGNTAISVPNGGTSAQTSSPPAAGGLVLDVTAKTHGRTVTLTAHVSGRVPQLYDAVTGTPIPAQNTEVSGTSITWGDGSQPTGSDGGEIACHADAPIVTLPPETFTEPHTYAGPGTYTIHFGAGACAPGSTGGKSYTKSISVTVRGVGAPTKTAVIFIRPVGPQGHVLPGYTVTSLSGHGDCSRGSESIGAEGYRCFASDGVSDPCWVESVKRAFVVCQSAPWTRSVWRIHVSKGFDNAGAGTGEPGDPWGLVTAAGAEFDWVDGGTSAVHGMRVNYGSTATHIVLVGDVDKAHRVWRIRRAKRVGPDSYVLDGWVRISTAWYAKPSLRG